MFFFFKQKTAYEMRISDWSSDVCSSDLGADSHTKLTHDTSPAPPVRISAARRWNLAWVAAPIAHAAPSSHSRANAGSMPDQRGDGASNDAVVAASTPASSATSTISISCRSEEHTSELQSLMRISYAV